MRAHQILIRVTTDERRAIRKGARSLGLSIAAFLRSLAMQALPDEKAPGRRQPVEGTNTKGNVDEQNSTRLATD